MGVSSPVASLVEFLEEAGRDPEYDLWCLRMLNRECPLHWYQIAAEVTRLEASLQKLGVEKNYQGMQLLLSQVYFHLDEYSKALTAACASKDWFIGYLNSFYFNQRNSTSDELRPMDAAKEYVDKIIMLAVDEQVARSAVHGDTAAKKAAPSESVDKLVKYILDVDHIDEMSDSLLKLVLGVLLESGSEEYLEKILVNENLMRYVMTSHEIMLASKKLQEFVLPVICRLFKSKLYNGDSLISLQANPALAEELPIYFQALCLCNEATGIADLLHQLIKDNEEKNVLRAYQLAFDLFTFGNQGLIQNVRADPKLQSTTTVEPPPPTPPATAGTEDNNMAEGGGEKITDVVAPTSEQDIILNRLSSILTGLFQARVLLKFSNAQNKTDLGILETLMLNIGGRHPILQTMLITTHAFMQRGTTCDTFLRVNLEWFSKPTLWGRFISTASLGVVHQTHNDKSFKVLSTYLPDIPGWTPGSSYTDGGALYALGLIHANMANDQVVKYLLTQLSGRSSTNDASNNASGNERSVNEVLQYGASLALGLVCMGNCEASVTTALESVLMMDSAVAGEAAALGLGLVNLGTCSESLIDSLLNYAEETRHDKIIRACGLGVALTCVKMQEHARPHVERMLESSDPLLRYGGCFALALSYVGSANSDAIKSLLHIAVSDPVDDVRQGAVLSLTFLLSNNVEKAPNIFKYLADSYNFRVRFAAILGLGMACAGSASAEALQIIKTATKDAHDLVRQAAFIALGLVLIECPDQIAAERLESASKETPRSDLVNVALDQREDPMARIGAILGLGIIDAGGRNCNITMTDRQNLVGLLLFSQYWYSYPLLLCLSLAFTPTALLGVNSNLQLPAGFKIQASCPPSQFAYPAKYVQKVKERNDKIPTSLLSAALRAGKATAVEPEKATGVKEVEKTVDLSKYQDGAAKKDDAAKADDVDMGEATEESKVTGEKKDAEVAQEDKKDVTMGEPQKEGEQNKAEAVEAVEEPNQTTICNGHRMVPMQMPLLEPILSSNSRYTPIFARRKLQNGNIVVLVDNQLTGSEEQFIME